MSQSFRIQQYVDTITPGEYFLAGDIGGTNSSFGVISYHDNTFEILLVVRAASQEVTDYAMLLSDIIEHLLQVYEITIRSACFGIAGIIQNHCRCVEPTNLQVKLDGNHLVQKTQLQELELINDFVAVATGIDYLDEDDVICVIEGSGMPKGNKASLGAGTGLGKVGMLWHEPAQQYLPIASEGGHSDFVVLSDFDTDFCMFLHKEIGIPTPISWEDVLSGDGIRYIYQFLGKHGNYPETQVSKEIASNNFNPDKISQYAQQDERAQKTFELYARWTGRCAKNWALDTLAFNGMYIAGGIAAKNISVFQTNEFRDAFYNSAVHTAFLEETPVYIIADYDVSLYGAASYYQLRKRGIV